MATDHRRRQGDPKVAADLYLPRRILLARRWVEHDGDDGEHRAEQQYRVLFLGLYLPRVGPGRVLRVVPLRFLV